MDREASIVFKDGPAGWRAALADGPDVWEVVRAYQEIDESDDAAVPAVAELLNLSIPQVRAALGYYADHSGQIDAEIEQNRVEAERAYQAWALNNEQA